MPEEMENDVTPGAGNEPTDAGLAEVAEQLRAKAAARRQQSEQPDGADEVCHCEVCAGGEMEEGRRADSTLNHKKHLKEKQDQRKAAGKKSAIARAARAAERCSFVKSAFGQLTSFQRACPYSADTMDALEATYKRLLIEAGFDLKTLTGLPFKVGRETLKSDLKRLGVRGWLRGD
jgi:hypothetical protein